MLTLVAPNICVERNYNVYKSHLFTDYFKNNQQQYPEMKMIFQRLASHGFYCPTIYKNQKTDSITLKYESEDNNIYIVIKPETITYHSDNITLYSTRTAATIRKTIEEFMR